MLFVYNAHNYGYFHLTQKERYMIRCKLETTSWVTDWVTLVYFVGYVQNMCYVIISKILLDSLIVWEREPMHLEVSHKLTSRSGTDDIGNLPNVTLCKIIQQYIKKKKEREKRKLKKKKGWTQIMNSYIHSKIQTNKQTKTSSNFPCPPQVQKFQKKPFWNQNGCRKWQMNSDILLD